jgi:hypothetical protein
MYVSAITVLKILEIRIQGRIVNQKAETLPDAPPENPEIALKIATHPQKNILNVSFVSSNVYIYCC